LVQFAVEAFVVSFVGALIGLFIGAVITVLIGLYTTFLPAPDIKSCLLAVGIATLIGTFFGCIPILRASKKDPIEALRQIG